MEPKPRRRTLSESSRSNAAEFFFFFKSEESLGLHGSLLEDLRKYQPKPSGFSHGLIPWAPSFVVLLCVDGLLVRRLSSLLFSFFFWGGAKWIPGKWTLFVSLFVCLFVCLFVPFFLLFFSGGGGPMDSW